MNWNDKINGTMPKSLDEIRGQYVGQIELARKAGLGPHIINRIENKFAEEIDKVLNAWYNQDKAEIEFEQNQKDVSTDRQRAVRELRKAMEKSKGTNFER